MREKRLALLITHHVSLIKPTAPFDDYLRITNRMLELSGHPTKSEIFTDYVLGLLDSAETRALEQHAAICDDCRSAIESERRISQLMRSTVATLPRANQTRLNTLMPAIPGQTQRTSSIWLRWQNGLAVAAVFVAMLIGNISLSTNGGVDSVNSTPIPALIAQTATATNQPTSTPTQLAQSTNTPLATPVPAFNSR